MPVGRFTDAAKQALVKKKRELENRSFVAAGSGRARAGHGSIAYRKPPRNF